MTTEPAQSDLVHFSTAGLEAPECFVSWCRLMEELYPAGIAVRQPSEKPFFASVRGRQLLRTRVIWGSYGATLNHMQKEANDDLQLVINLKGSIVASQHGKDVHLDPGDACLMRRSEAYIVDRPLDGALVGVRVPCEDITPYSRAIDANLWRKIPRGTEGLSMLSRYVWMLDESEPLDNPQSLALVTSHIHDLVALVLGADREARETRVGLRAAQFKAIKAYVEQHISQGNLSPVTLAPRFGLSARTIQRLFEDNGVTFTEFVRDQRLLFAKRLLSSPRHRHKSVAEIALDAGFGDISHFNRDFRRRFDQTPSDVRNARQD